MKHQFMVVAVVALSACSLPVTETPSELPVLSETAQHSRFAAFQEALELAQNDQPTPWQTSRALGGIVTPIDTIHSAADGWCRSYEEIIADGQKRYHLVGIACRKSSQGWLVLDVRPFTEQG
jgi:surface antigen